MKRSFAKTYFWIFVVFVVLVIYRMLFTTVFAPPAPSAQSGLLDLSGWDFDRDGVVQMDGEWLFYPGELLQPGEQPQGEAIAVELPGKWDHYVSGDGQSTPFGYGTYRLETLLPGGEERSYAVRVLSVRTAHNLYVNGELVGHSGKPGVDHASSDPSNMPYLTAIDVQDGRADIMIQVSNFHYRTIGGIFDRLLIGNATDVYYGMQVRVAWEAVLGGLYLLSGLFLALVYAGRVRNKELLVFAVFFVSFGVYVLVRGEKLLFVLLDLSYTLATRMQHSSALGVFIALLLFGHGLYPRLKRGLVFWLLAAFAAVGMLVITTADVRIFTGLDRVLAAYFIVVFLYFLRTLLVGTKENSDRNERIYALIAALCVLYQTLAEGLMYAGVTTPILFAPVEMFVLMVSWALLIARKFFYNLEQVEQLSARLLLSDRLKNEFMVNAYYEIKTPLHGMINIAQAMKGDAQLADNHKRRLQRLVENGHTLVHALDDMLDLTKLHEGAIALKLERLDVRMTVTAVLEVMRHMTDRDAVKLNNLIRRELPLVAGDEQRVMQMLFNIIRYVLKFGSSGVVEVDALYGNKGFVEISVRHIPAEAGAASSAGSTSGTNSANSANSVNDASGANGAVGADDERGELNGALELDMSHQLAKLHGGTLSVETSADGARAVLALPVVGDAATSAPTAAATEARLQVTAAALGTEAAGGQGGSADPGRTRHRAAPHPGAPRILLAESDPAELEAMAVLLEGEGYDVTAVSSSELALSELDKSGMWDLAVVAVIMPRLSGYELCRRIRERFSYHDLPVLFLTSRSQPADLLVGFDAGGNDYATKPVNASEFIARVHTLLQIKRSVREKLLIEIALMQAQIKPHFLYNTLNTLASLGDFDQDAMRSLLVEFGKYLRGSFDRRNLDDVVPFLKEWELMKSYLKIEMARFGERLRLELREPDNMSFTIPPLTIQPLVENALRHGVLRRYEGGTVCIAVSETPEGHLIEIMDDGVGFPLEKWQRIASGEYEGGIGMHNVHRRLKHAYGQGLSVASCDNGTKVSFVIPRAKEER